MATNLSTPRVDCKTYRINVDVVDVGHDEPGFFKATAYVCVEGLTLLAQASGHGEDRACAFALTALARDLLAKYPRQP